MKGKEDLRGNNKSLQEEVNFPKSCIGSLEVSWEGFDVGCRF